MTVFRVVVLCSPVQIYRSVRGACCLRDQGDRPGDKGSNCNSGLTLTIPLSLGPTEQNMPLLSDHKYKTNVFLFARLYACPFFGLHLIAPLYKVLQSNKCS
jgi:hypothetical protein